MEEAVTAEEIFQEIKTLPRPEMTRLIECVRQLDAEEIPEDFLEALDQFEQGRFLSMDTALEGIPPRQ